MSNRQKFATQMDVDLLAKLREHAQKEGRHIQAIIEESVQDYMNKKAIVLEPKNVRPEVMEIAKKHSERYKETLAWLAQ